MDERFSTRCDTLEALLDRVDVDGPEDIETLLMVLFDRPIAFHQSGDDAETAEVEVVVALDGIHVGTALSFPLSVLDLVRECEGAVSEWGPTAVSGRDDDQLIGLLQRALGTVRVLALLDSDE